MKLTELKSIVQGGESHILEFKKSTAQLRACLETICAFLNNQGGTVLIGVTTKGEIIGQDISDKTKQSIANELAKLEPPIQIDVYYVPLTGGKQVIVFQTKSGPHQPYIYDGRSYYREQSVTNRMPQQRYDQFVAARLPLNFAWDEIPAKGYSIRDLDRNLILGVVRKSVEVKRMPEEALRQSVPKILAALNLTIDDQLKNAAVVLFAKKTFSAYPQCQLKMARFKGIDRDEFLDSDLLYGNVFELLEKGFLFVRRHLPLSGKIEFGKVERIEELLIPFKAVREALINALCHRDYSSRSGSIGLAIYDDRMEIFNDGGLPHGITIEKIKAGFSKPRNSLIADVFYRCEMIEKWGRGIPKIINSCRMAHDPEPEFMSDQVEFKVLFKFPKSLKPSVPFRKEEYPEYLSERQKEILKILTNIPKGLKAKEIVEKLKTAPASRTLRDDLAMLKKSGVVESWGRGRNAIWFVSYKKEPEIL